MSTEDPNREQGLSFGRPDFTPRFISGRDWPVEPGWSLGGLTARGRARMASYVLENPETGIVHDLYPLVGEWAPAQFEPSRAGLVAATGLLAADHPQLWTAGDLVAVAARRALEAQS